MITKLFISRPPQDIPLLAKFCQDHQIELEAKSLIRFEPLEFEQPENYDVIFANINRNILLADIPAYVKVLKADGRLLLSGFYKEDIPIIDEEVAKHGLTLNKTIDRNTN